MYRVRCHNPVSVGVVIDEQGLQVLSLAFETSVHHSMEVENERVNDDHNGTNLSAMSSSFLIIPTSDAANVEDDRIEITTIYPNKEFGQHGDASDFDRNVSEGCGDSRESLSRVQQVTVVNTYNSILDLESQSGDDEISFSDDEEENGPMGIASSTRAKNDRKREKSVARPVSPCQSRVHINGNADERNEDRSMMGALTLDSVTDSFVDSFCTSTACVVSDKYVSYKSLKRNKNKSAIDSMDGKINDFQESCHSKIRNSNDTDPRTIPEPSKLQTKDNLSLDIWRLLGCSFPPGESELDDIWYLKTTSDILKNVRNPKGNGEIKHPTRASIKKRLRRIHRLRMDDRRVSGASRHGVTITNHSLDSSHHTLNNIRNEIHMNKASMGKRDETGNILSNDRELQAFAQPSYRAIEKSYSMLDDPLANFIGKGMVDPIPIEVEFEDGYDSDPEINYYTSTSMVLDSPTVSESAQMEESSSYSSGSIVPSILPEIPPLSHVSDTDNIKLNEHCDMLRVNPLPTDELEMKESVQQTLNSTWTLTWHPNAANRKMYNIPHTKPICINMWLERGTVITNSGVVIEPAFMWRDAYQPLLLSQHKLNTSTQKPWSMRLLDACRIVPYFSTRNQSTCINRTEYPFARQKASFLLKSCGDEEFLLEAGSAEDAIAITERWKLVVARFACLAVTEDVGGIAKEFFHPTCSDSQMLTIADPHS